jgi:ribosome biogenesis protein BMS1
MHLPGVGDVTVSKVEQLPDPCPLPNREEGASGRKRKLLDKERSIHAPMGEVSGISYDQDAIYINLPNHTVRFTGNVPPETEGEWMIRDLQQIKVSRRLFMK